MDRDATLKEAAVLWHRADGIYRGLVKAFGREADAAAAGDVVATERYNRARERLVLKWEDVRRELVNKIWLLNPDLPAALKADAGRRGFEHALFG